MEAESVVMSASLAELQDSLFEDPSFQEKSLRFASDAGCQVVYITRERYLDADEDGEYPLPPFTSVGPTAEGKLKLCRQPSRLDKLSASPSSDPYTLAQHSFYPRTD